MRVEDEVPLEASEAEVGGLELVAAGGGATTLAVVVMVVTMVVQGSEEGLWHAELGVEGRPQVAHGQLELELAVGVREVAAVEVADGDVVAVALRGRVEGELDLLPGEGLVDAEVLAVEQREREVDVDAHALRRVAPHQVHSEDLVRAGEGDGPSLVAARELLARDVTLQVAGHGLGHDEREHVRVGAVVQLGEAVQQRHGCLDGSQHLRHKSLANKITTISIWHYIPKRLLEGNAEERMERRDEEGREK